MRTFTQEEYQRIEANGYLQLPSYFVDGTLEKELAFNVVKTLSNETVVEKEILDEVVFICYSNGAKLAPMTAVIPKDSFHYFENFSKVVTELYEHNFDKKQILNSFLILYLNNIINIYPEESFAHNFAVDKTWHFSLPAVTSTINLIELIVELVEKNKPAFISFINYQDILIEKIITTKLKDIFEKEQKLSEELSESKISIEELNLKNEKVLVKNEQLVQENKENIESNRSNIITIVSLIVGIVPLVIVNLSILANSFNLILLLCINGILLSIISIIYYFLERIVNSVSAKNNKPFITFIVIGLVLLILGITLSVVSEFIPAIAEFFKSTSL